MGTLNLFTNDGTPDKPYALAVSLKDFELLTGCIRMYARTFLFATKMFDDFDIDHDQTGVTSQNRIEELYSRLVKQFKAQQ